MGTRYILEIDCPKCSYHDDNAYYAPTCGIIVWHCPKCKYQIDLEKHTDIIYEDASNMAAMKSIIRHFKKMERNYEIAHVNNS